MEHSHDGHRSRLRARYEQAGLAGFPLHEVFELMLYDSIPLRDVNELAHDLADHFPSLSGLMRADYEHLMGVSGVGHYTARHMEAKARLVDAYLHSKIQDRPRLNTPVRAMRYARETVSPDPPEQLWLLGLTKDGYLVCRKWIGSVEALLMGDWRNLMDFLLANRVRAAITIQRCTARQMHPGIDDKQRIERVCSMLHPLHIDLLDDILLCGHRFLSLHQLGFIEKHIKMPRQCEEVETSIFADWM